MVIDLTWVTRVLFFLIGGYIRSGKNSYLRALLNTKILTVIYRLYTTHMIVNARNKIASENELIKIHRCTF